MTFLFISILLAGLGFPFLALSGLNRRHPLFDVPAAWVAASGIYSLAAFIYHLLSGGFSPWPPFIATALLSGVILAARFNVISAAAAPPAKGEAVAMKKTSPLQTAAIIGAALVFLALAAHQASTPVTSDDSLRVRAFGAMTVYSGWDSELEVMRFNGPLFSYLPGLYWEIAGSFNPFFINYIHSVFLLSFWGILAGMALTTGLNRPVLSLWLIACCPLLITISGTQLMDGPMALMLALGFFFFILYCGSYREKDLLTALFFFSVTLLIKNKGVMLGFGAISFSLVTAVAYSRWRKYRHNWKKILLHLIPALLFLAAEKAGFGSSSVQAVMGNMAHNVIAASAQPMNYGTKFWLSMFSLFASGNFGITFYLLVFYTFFFFRRLPDPSELAPVIFLYGILSAGLVYFVFYRNSLEDFADYVHRGMLIPAMIACIWLGGIADQHREQSKNTP